MQADSFPTAYRASQRSYELGRLWVAARRAVVVVLVVAGAAALTLGRSALVWLPMTLLASIVTEWRGSFLMRGARRGLLVGLASIIVPLSLLRPCCGVDAKSMGMTCCITPSACWAAGAIVGLAAVLFVPRAPDGRRLHAIVGMAIGIVSVAVLRCSMLFVGEAFGLVGGMTAGALATAFARSMLRRIQA